MSELFHAVEVFFERLAAVEWRFLALAVAFHVLKLGAVSRAWRNILAVAYPGTRVRGRTIFGAYAAGVGMNAILPARTGDALKLHLAKRGIEGATYPTLTSTLLVQTIFDFAVASLLFLWALSLGVLPGLDLLPDLPSLDFSWIFDRPRLAAVVGGILLIVAAIGAQWIADHGSRLRERFAQGFAVLRQPRLYARRVIPWQVADWTCRLVTIYFFLRAFSIDATAHNAFVVQVTQSLSTIFPFTPGGVGTEQALVVYAFRGEAAVPALLSFSVGMKLTIIAVNVAVGFAAMGLMLKTLRWRRPARDDEHARAHAEPGVS